MEKKDTLVTHREKPDAVERGLFAAGAFESHAGMNVFWVHNLDVDQDRWTYSTREGSPFRATVGSRALCLGPCR